MGQEPQATRLLSGEIFASPARPFGGAGSGDVVDADYIVIEPPRPEHRPVHVAAPATAADPSAGMATLRRAAPARPTERWAPAGVAFWLFGLLLVASSFWISGGHALVSR